jgi:hypothetical protein
MAKRDQVRRRAPRSAQEYGGMAAGPIYSQRRPSPDLDPTIVIIEENHAHSDPSHHIGPCDEFCRRGIAPHRHRARVGARAVDSP